MNFEDFKRQGIIKKATKNPGMIHSLVENAEKDIKFLDTVKVNENSSRKIMTNYYDVLRSILEAIALDKGYKIYSHEAFTEFLKKINEEIIALKFDRFRKIRKAINYYGKDISVEETIDNIKNIKEIIKILKKRYLL